MSRAYVHDYSGLLSGTLILLAHLWPDRFEFDVVEEVFAKGSRSQLLDAQVEKGLPFFHAHPVWYASATYHLTEQIERAIFKKPAGT
ncbi:MAG: hypothetical protein HKL95_06630 [Phycisphaerae bacterium]|nr:hypothetical protein [Phycisphaerae bacterium]